MKLKIVLISLVVLVAVGAGGVYLFFQSLKPAKEEHIIYDNKVVATIEPQLKGLDLEKIRSKKDLIMEKSVEELQSAIKNGQLTYTELTAFYLDRIATLDKAKKGINAVAEINPNAIKEAQSFDATPRSNGKDLYGIPVLLKDNINTKDMPTSGGTFALKDFVPKEDAAVVTNLRKNNAVILGKANLSELANFMAIQMPSGYNSKAGQTNNPFDPTVISPLGSSSGSAAAAAVNFSAVTIGTETTGSIIAPAAIQSVVGFKPTKDSISTEGVIPLSSTLDTVGPITKNVTDAVITYNASLTDSSKAIALPTDPNYLKGKKIGVLKTKESEKLVEQLKKTGAEVVELEKDEKGLDNVTILNQDFKFDLAEYAKKYGTPFKSLKELIDFNDKESDRRAKYGQNLLDLADKTEKRDAAKVDEIVKLGKERLQAMFDKNKLDAIAFVGNEGSILAALGGVPEITVPLGMDDKNSPIGATFITKSGEDEKAVQAAFSFEQITKLRKIPEKYLKIIEK